MTVEIVAFYRFFEVEDPEKLKAWLQDHAPGDCRGTVLIATEGLNGTLCGAPGAVLGLLDSLAKEAGFCDRSAFKPKSSHSEAPPFDRFRVRVKPEIVSFKQDTDPNERVGKYVEPADWNELIERDDVVVIDTRNQYEIKVGRFENAVDPGTEFFWEFADYVDKDLARGEHKDKKVAMYCTGGIRCEKATSYLLERGFEDVYHLHGGILRYLEEVPSEQSKWQGECFVFDNRISVDHALAPGTHEVCFMCGWPLSPEDLEHPDFERGLSCSECKGKIDEDRFERGKERHKQLQLKRLREG